MNDAQEAVPTEGRQINQNRPVYRNTITNFDGKVTRYTEHTSDIADVITSLAASEQDELEPLDSKDIRSLAWAFHSRIFVSVLVHLAQIAIRLSDKVLTEAELKHFQPFARANLLRKFRLPVTVIKTLYSRIHRIPVPMRSFFSYPYIRSGLFISPFIQRNSSNGPFREIWVSSDYTRIPSVRVATNFIYLHRNRRNLLTETPHMAELITKFLLVGYHCDEALVIHKRPGSPAILDLLLQNVIFNHRLGSSTPKQVSDSLDAIDYIFEPKGIVPQALQAESISHDHNAWIEPLPDMFRFEQLNLFSLKSFESRETAETSCPNGIDFTIDHGSISLTDESTMSHQDDLISSPISYSFWLDVLFTN